MLALAVANAHCQARLRKARTLVWLMPSTGCPSTLSCHRVSICPQSFSNHPVCVLACVVLFAHFSCWQVAAALPHAA